MIFAETSMFGYDYRSFLLRYKEKFNGFDETPIQIFRVESLNPQGYYKP